MLPLTERQREVFQYLKSHVKRTGQLPSYRKIARHIKISSAATVQKHIKAIERRGHLTRVRENGLFAIDFNGTTTAPTFRAKQACQMPASLRWQIWERDNFTCLCCGARHFLCVDHIKPWQKGGARHGPENLQTLCNPCNARKGARTISYRK